MAWQVKDDGLGCSQRIIDLDDRVSEILNIDITTLYQGRSCSFDLTLKKAKELRGRLDEWICQQNESS